MMENSEIWSETLHQWIPCKGYLDRECDNYIKYEDCHSLPECPRLKQDNEGPIERFMHLDWEALFNTPEFLEAQRQDEETEKRILESLTDEDWQILEWIDDQDYTMIGCIDYDEALRENPHYRKLHDFGLIESYGDWHDGSESIELTLQGEYFLYTLRKGMEK